MSIDWLNHLPKEDQELLDNPDWVWVLEKNYQSSKNHWTHITIGVYRNFYRLIGESRHDWYKPSQNSEDALHFRADDLDGKSHFTATCLPFL